MMTFPCEFPIKIIVKNEPGVQETLLGIIRRHHADFVDSTLRTKASENGQFISITATVFAQDQIALDALYYDLTAAPHIIMVL